MRRVARVTQGAICSLCADYRLYSRSPVSDTPTRRAADRLGEFVPFIAVALVVYRVAVWLFWDHAHFDADQGMVGLMAKHLAEGRAWPLLFYGQHYMLAVEAWLVAPFVGVLGMTVFSVKLPLVLLNLVVALLLLRRLEVDSGLGPWAALVASLFFVLPGPITSSRLIDAMGASIEPFVYTLLLWTLRERPVWFGLVAGIGIVHREFTVYAVAAVWLLEVWHRRGFSRAAITGKAIVVAEIVAINLIVTWLKPHADLMGPGTGGTFGAAVMSGQAEFVASRFCVSPSEIGVNLTWLFRDNLAALFGYYPGRFGLFTSSRLSGGTPWAWMPLLVACGAGMVGAAIAWRRASPEPARSPASSRSAPAQAFPAFLILVGLQAVAVYALVNCDVREPQYVRYTLLALFVPVGLVALALRPDMPRALRGGVVAATLTFAAAGGYDGGRVLAEFRHRRPPDEYRMLADFLEREGVRYGRAPYWTAYRMVFLTDERVLITGTDKVRVREYDNAVAEHGDEAVDIYYADGPCPEPGAVLVARWCVVHLERVRGTP